MLSIIGFVLSFVSVVLIALGFAFDFALYAMVAVIVLSMAGIILSSIGCKKGLHKGLAIAGIVLNIILLLVSLIIAAFVGFVIAICSAIFKGLGDGLSGDPEGMLLPAMFIL